MPYLLKNLRLKLNDVIPILIKTKRLCKTILKRQVRWKNLELSSVILKKNMKNWKRHFVKYENRKQAIEQTIRNGQ